METKTKTKKLSQDVIYQKLKNHNPIIFNADFLIFSYWTSNHVCMESRKTLKDRNTTWQQDSGQLSHDECVRRDIRVWNVEVGKGFGRAVCLRRYHCRDLQVGRDRCLQASKLPAWLEDSLAAAAAPEPRPAGRRMATVAPVLCSAVSVAYVVWGGSWVVVMELRWEEGRTERGWKIWGRCHLAVIIKGATPKSSSFWTESSVPLQDGQDTQPAPRPSCHQVKLQTQQQQQQQQQAAVHFVHFDRPSHVMLCFLSCGTSQPTASCN